MDFTLDASMLNETEVVVFERLYYQNYEITSHADINDEEQTILITRNPRYRRHRAAWINTGAGRDLIIYGGIGIPTVILLIVFLMKRGNRYGCEQSNIKR